MKTTMMSLGRKTRGEPLRSQKISHLYSTVNQTRRSFTTGGRHRIMTPHATMSGGSPLRMTEEEEMQIDAEEGLENSPRVLNTGEGHLIHL